MKIDKTLMNAILPVLVVTLAGCNAKTAPQTITDTANASAATSGNRTTVASANFDPCSVMTPDEVTAITTDKVSRTEVIDHDCYYHTTWETDGAVLSIYPSGGKQEMQDTREGMNLLGGIGSIAAGQGDVGKDVQAAITSPKGGAPAMGDEVMWEPNDVLAVRKGDIFVQVAPMIVHDPATHRGLMISEREKRGTSEKLAEAVLAKLSH